MVEHLLKSTIREALIIYLANYAFSFYVTFLLIDGDLCDDCCPTLVSGRFHILSFVFV